MLHRGEWPDQTAFAHPSVAWLRKKNSLDHIGEILLNDLPRFIRTETFFELGDGFIYSSLYHFHIQFQLAVKER